MKKKSQNKSPSCRKKGETVDECVSRKIPELKDEGMDQEAAVGAAFGMCRRACSKKKKVCDTMYSLKGFVTKQADDRTFKVVASTDSIDREGEIIEQGGWELDNYMKNPVILWAHDIQSLPIGKATSVKVEGDELIIEGIFAEKEGNPMAENVYQLFKAGIQTAVSVGFIPLEREGSVITKAELLELSFVPVPANPEAHARAIAKGLDESLFAKSTKVEDKAVKNNQSSKRYNARNFRKLLMKRKQEEVPTPANGLEEEIMATETELKEAVLDIVMQSIPDIEAAVEKQLEGEPVVEELMKEIEEVIEKSLDEVMDMVVEDVTEVVEMNGEADLHGDEVVEESEQAVDAILKDVGAEIADEVASVIESKAEEILSAVDEEKQNEAEENLAPVIKEIEELIEKEVEEVLADKTVTIAEEAVNEVGTGEPEEKGEHTDVCDPESPQFDPEECARVGGEVMKAGHEEDEKPKKPKKKE